MIKAFKNFLNFCWNIYHKNEEVWSYLITGAIGVVISVGTYSISRNIGFSILSSNIISWIIAVISMYIMNKLFVFKTKCSSFIKLSKEFFSFIGARVFTLVVESLILWCGADILNINDILVKIVAQIIIIIMNYIFSKLFIFKK